MNSIRQISVFVENKQGRLSSIIRIIRDSGIDIRALSIADTKDFGILRLIVDNTDKACSRLRDENCTVAVTKVVAVEIDDEPGCLSRVMDVLAEENVDIEYMYAFLSKSDNKASIILRVDDNEKASKAFKDAGVLQLTENDLCKM